MNQKLMKKKKMNPRKEKVKKLGQKYKKKILKQMKIRFNSNKVIKINNLYLKSH